MDPNQEQPNEPAAQPSVPPVSPEPGVPQAPPAPQAPLTPEPAVVPPTTPEPQSPIQAPAQQPAPPQEPTPPAALEQPAQPVAPEPQAAVVQPPEVPAQPQATPNIAPAPQAGQVQPGQVPLNQPAPGGGNKKKMIKYGLVSLALLTAVLVVVFGGIKLFGVLTGSSLAEYSSDKLGYSINYPEGWEVDSSSEDSIEKTWFTESNGDGENLYRASMSVTKEDGRSSYGTFSEFSSALKDAIESSIERDEGRTDTETFSNLKWSETTIDGYDAAVAEIDVTNVSYDEGETGKSAAAFVFVSPDVYYLVSLDVHDSDMNYFDMYNDMFSSLDVK